MNEVEAKKTLRKLLRNWTLGSLLHLLADICKDDADQAAGYEDAVVFGRLMTVHATLVVVGMGVDAACPR